MSNYVVNHSTQNPNSNGMLALAKGKELAMRMWKEGPRETKEVRSSSYETIGFVLKGEAILSIGANTFVLKEGDSYLVPAGSEHTYTIKTYFESVEVINEPREVPDASEQKISH